MTRKEHAQDANYPAVDITDRIREKFSQYLQPDIVFVRIVQSRDTVWLEITRQNEVGGHLMDQSITRTDLRFIIEPGCERYEYETYPRFNPRCNIYINADIFADDFDPYSILMTTDLFRRDAVKEINEPLNEDGPGI